MTIKDSSFSAISESKKNILILLIIVLTNLLAFANSTLGEFVVDDHGLIQENADIRSLSRIPKLFQQGYWANEPSIGHYRPIPMVTFAFDYAINGLNPYGYHLTNIFIHTLSCLLIYWLCNKYTEKKLLSLLCAVFFSLHPVHCEIVSIINGRPELLATMFLLAAWCFYLKSFENNYWYILSLFVFFLSLLSKETSFTFIGILMLAQVCTNPTWSTRLIPNKKIIGYVLMTFPYLLLRVLITGAFGVPQGGQYFLPTDTFLMRVYTMSYGYLGYFRMLVWPKELRLYYANDFIVTQTSLTLGIALALLLITSIIAIGIWQIKKNPIIAFGILFFFVASSIASNIFIVTGHLIAERVIYLASLSICLLAATLLYYLYEQGWQKTTICLSILLSLMLLGRTYYRNIDFQNDFSLNSSVVKISPGNLPANFALGLYYESQEQLDKAETYFKKSMQINPRYGSVYAILGNIYIKQGRYDEALTALQQQITLTPTSALPYVALGRLYSIKQDYKKSVEAYYQAVKYAVPHAKLENEVALALLNANNLQEAEVHFRKSVLLDPTFSEALVNLAKVLQKQNQYDQSKEFIDKALELAPNEADTYILYGTYLLAKNDLCGAKNYLLKALSINRQAFEAHYQLGIVYTQMNFFEGARLELQTALSLKPKLLEAREKLNLITQQSLTKTKADMVKCPD